MRYQIRPGVVPTQICGVYLLIASRAALAYCRPMRGLDLMEIFCIQCIERNLPVENLYRGIAILTNKSDEEAVQLADETFKKLADEGWLIPEDEA